MSENSCILIKEIDCDNLLLVEEATPTVIVESDPIVLLVACEQGPAGKDGLDGTGVLEVASGPVANGNTITADSVAIATYRSVKWIVTITDSLGGLYKSYEVMAVHNDSTVLFSVYAIVGDTISVFTDVDVNAGQMRLQITNNIANDIDVKVQRIATTI